MAVKISSIIYNEKKSEVIVTFQNGTKLGAIGKLAPKIYQKAEKLVEINKPK